jgi:NTE family protein
MTKASGDTSQAPARTAFVLAGGGSLGAIQAGMLAELIVAGVRPDFIVGVSAGAINGAFLAHDPSESTANLIAELWCKVNTREALGVSWRSLLGMFFGAGHLGHSRGLRGILERQLPYRQFETARVPLHIIAAEESTGSEVVLSRGDIIDAVLASTAIPGVFAPVIIGGRTLVDGAVVCGTPIATAARLGATRILVLPCGFTCVGKAIPRHAFGRALHAITLQGAYQLRQDFQRYTATHRLRLVPPLCPLAHSAYDYSQGARLIAAGRESTLRWLEGGGLDDDSFPMQLQAHVH